MRILVVGGCGFIGSHIVDALLAARHNVRVFDRQPERYRKPLDGVDYRFGNFADKMALIEAMSGVEAVMHLVSTTFPGTADLDPRADVQDNLVSTIGLLEAMQGLQIRRVLYLSSGGTVYGPPEVVPIPEDHPLRPINSYGIVKVAIESFLALYGRSRGISPIIIRPSNPFGPRQGHIGVQGVVNTFLRRIHGGEQIEIWGDGEVVRDYLDVTELADLCVRAVTSDREGAYNAGSGRGHTINEIVAAIRDVVDRDVSVVHKSARTLDVPRSILDTRRAAADFGWTCSPDFRTGIARTWDWIKANA